MNPSLQNLHRVAYIIYTGLVHEVGHFLGLMHTFEDGCSSKSRWHRMYGGKQYYFQNGDGVQDTPAHAGFTTMIPETKYCWIGQNVDTCPDSLLSSSSAVTADPSTGRFDPGLDPVDNIMNYIWGRCRRDYGRFTTGQIERMIAQYERYRLGPAIPKKPPNTKKRSSRNGSNSRSQPKKAAKVKCRNSERRCKSATTASRPKTTITRKKKEPVTKTPEIKMKKLTSGARSSNKKKKCRKRMTACSIHSQCCGASRCRKQKNGKKFCRALP